MKNWKKTIGTVGTAIVLAALLPACGGGGGGGGTPVDIIPPVISSLSVSPTLLTPGSDVTIEATVADNDRLDTVTAVVTFPDNQQVTVNLRRSSNPVVYSGMFVAQWQPTQTANTARVQVRARDAAGNQAQRETSVRLTALPPDLPSF